MDELTVIYANHRLAFVPNSEHMKRLITLVVGIVILAFNANEIKANKDRLIDSSRGNNDEVTMNDIGFEIGTLVADPGTNVCVPVSVTQFEDVVSAQFTIVWNSDYMSYTGISNPNSLEDLANSSFGTSNASDGVLGFSWFHNATTGVTLDDNTVIFEICFDVLVSGEGQDASISMTGSPTIIEVTDNTGAELNFMGTNGLVEISGEQNNTPDPLVLNIGSGLGDVGDEVCVGVAVSTFVDLTELSFSLNWNENNLSYSHIDNLNLSSLSAGDFDASMVSSGNFGVSWTSNIGVDVVDGTEIFNVCFDLLEAGAGSTETISVGSMPVAIGAENSTIQSVEVTPNAGTVSINPLQNDGVVIFSIENTNAQPGETVCLDMSVEGFFDIASFQYTVIWAESILEYQSVQGFNIPHLNAGSFGDSQVADGVLTVSWFDNDTNGVTVSNNTVLYQMCFEVLGDVGQNTIISFTGNPTSVEVADSESNILTFNGGIGQVNVVGEMATDDVVFTIGSDNVLQGEETCVSVTTDHFTDVVGMQYSINWDSEVLEFLRTENYNLAGLNAGSFGTTSTALGSLTLSWLDENTTGVDLVNGTVLFDICFEGVGAVSESSLIGISGSPLGIEVSNSNQEVLMIETNSGQITVQENNNNQPNDLTFVISDEDIEESTTGCVDVSVLGFVDILSMQFSINWDASVFSYSNVQDFGLPFLSNSAFGNQSIDNGVLTVSWFDDNTEGISLDDNTVIFSICFEAIGDVGEVSDILISGSPLAVEIADAEENIIVAEFQPGTSVIVDGINGSDEINFAIADAIVEMGSEVCLDVSTTGFNSITSFQYSVNWDETLLEFVSVGMFNLEYLDAGDFGTSNVGAGNFTVSWIDDETVGVDVIDNEVLYQICFLAIGEGGSSAQVSITGTPMGIEIGDENQNLVNYNLTPGTATINEANNNTQDNQNITFYIEDEVVDAGTNACFPVYVDDFIDIVSFQYSLNWDPNVLTYTGIDNINLVYLNNGSFAANTAIGQLGVSWFDDDTIGKQRDNGTAIFEICFDINENASNTSQISFTGTPTIVEVTEAVTDDVLPVSFDNAIISINAISNPGDFEFTYQCQDGMPGDLVCIPVSTGNFDGIRSFQYSMHWNPSILSFQSVQNFNLVDLGMNDFGLDPSNGTISIVWIHEAGIGASVDNNTQLFELCFEIVGDLGDSSLLSFDGSPTIIEATNADGELPINFNSCTVNVTGSCPIINIQANTVSDVICRGGNDGAIDISVTGGNGNYTYQWTNLDSGFQLSTIQDITGLANGNYGVVVTSCDGAVTAEEAFFIDQPEANLAINPVVQNVSCFNGQDGAITLNPSGGVPDYQFEWSGGNLTSNPNSSNIENLVSGTYSVTLTDENGCEIFETFTVNQPSAALTVSPVTSDITCNGADDGFIQINAQFGYGGYTYNWSDIALSGGNPASVDPGLYSVTVEDAGGCSIVLTHLEVIEPDLIQVQAIVENINNQQTGSINLSVSGGTGPNTYLYNWTGPEGFVPTNSPNLTNLTIGGEYCVELFDANNCLYQNCFTVESPLGIIQLEVNHACPGIDNGSILVNSFGGQGEVSYLWTLNGENFATTEDIEQLAGGLYTLTISDEANNEESANFTVQQAAQEISGEIIMQNVSNVDFCDGMLTLDNVFGGYGGYTYLWSNNATTSTISNLCEGNYSVVITDSNGCETTLNATIQFDPDPLQAQVTAQNTLCFDSCNGSIEVNITSGYAPFTVKLKDQSNEIVASIEDTGTEFEFENLCAQVFTVEITDNLGQVISIENMEIIEPNELLINEVTVFPVTQDGGNNSGAISINVIGGTPQYNYLWNNGTMGPDNINLPIGTYSPTITDDNGCVVSIPTIQVSKFEIQTAEVTNNNCKNDLFGQICLDVVGGAGDYTYTWSNGADQACNNELLAGNYSVTITDNASGVSINQSYEITTESNLTIETEATSEYIEGANISCAGLSDGQAQVVNVTGHVGEVTFKWSVPGEMNQIIDNIPAGTYSVTVTDQAGCNEESEVTLTEPAPIAISFDVIPITCNNESNASICANISGGATQNIQNLNLEWQGPGLINAFQNCIDNLGTGEYLLSVQDANGCSAQNNILIVNPNPIEVEIITSPDDGSNTGTAQAIVTGGSGEYRYDWRLEESIGTTQEITNLQAGVYSLMITDTNGCIEIVSDIIINDSALDCLSGRLVITPNNDLLNDEFVINCIETFPENTLEIFSRWGQLVFTQTNYMCAYDDCEKGWTGLNSREEELPQGAYFYVLTYKDNIGETQQKKGHVTLLRE